MCSNTNIDDLFFEEDEVKYSCYFRYIAGNLSYIGLIESQKVKKVQGVDIESHMDGVFQTIKVADYNPVFNGYRDNLLDFIVCEFSSKEKAQLYTNFYTNLFKPEFNKRLVQKSEYGAYEQNKFIPEGFTYNSVDSMEFLINILHTEYSTEVISAITFLDERVVDDMCDRVGEYQCTLQPYEHSDKKGNIKVDKNLISHFKIFPYVKCLLDLCEKKYMKITPHW